MKPDFRSQLEKVVDLLEIVCLRLLPFILIVTVIVKLIIWIIS